MTAMSAAIPQFDRHRREVARLADLRGRLAQDVPSRAGRKVSDPAEARRLLDALQARVDLYQQDDGDG